MDYSAYMYGHMRDFSSIRVIGDKIAHNFGHNLLISGGLEAIINRG